MARRPRAVVVVPGFPHHVITRGNNRRRLFATDNERFLFVRLLERAAEQTECLVHQLTLQDNHTHSVITPPSVDALSRMMKSLQQPFAQRVNRARGTTGKLFEQRYDAIPVLDERYLATLVPYVDLNPERAGRRGAARFRWTTMPFHTGEGISAIPRGLWTPLEWYLGLGSTDESRQRSYRAFVEERRIAGRIREIDAREIDPRRGHRPRRPDETSAR